MLILQIELVCKRNDALVWIYTSPLHHLSSEKPGSIFFHKRIFRPDDSRLCKFPHLYNSRESRSLPLFISSRISSNSLPLSTNVYNTSSPETTASKQNGFNIPVSPSAKIINFQEFCLNLRWYRKTQLLFTLSYRSNILLE